MRRALTQQNGNGGRSQTTQTRAASKQFGLRVLEEVQSAVKSHTEFNTALPPCIEAFSNFVSVCGGVAATLRGLQAVRWNYVFAVLVQLSTIHYQAVSLQSETDTSMVKKPLIPTSVLPIITGKAAKLNVSSWPEATGYHTAYHADIISIIELCQLFSCMPCVPLQPLACA